MEIQLHIERLILEGLPVTRAQGALVQAAVEAELTRLLAERGLSQALQSGGAVPSLRARAIQLGPDGQLAQLGAQIGQAVYGGLGPKATR
jgi:hypothetical protein